jgi:hypothetical protein
MTRLTRVAASAARAAGHGGWQSRTQACWRRWTSWSIPIRAGTPPRRCGGRPSPPRQLADALVAQGFQVSDDTVGRLLKQQRYTRDRGRCPASRPGRAVSVCEPAGQAASGRRPAGRQRGHQEERAGGPLRQRRCRVAATGEPEWVNVHDFPDPQLGKAIPYGVYDLGANSGWVSVGTDHDTAAFAVATLRRWWEQVGSRAYPQATRLLVTADAGGSNGYRVPSGRRWGSWCARGSCSSGLARRSSASTALAPGPTSPSRGRGGRGAYQGAGVRPPGRRPRHGRVRLRAGGRRVPAGAACAEVRRPGRATRTITSEGLVISGSATVSTVGGVL